jgi:hypothetical protein
MRVQIAFDLNANGVGDYFTLDDATKGVLDNVTYELAGDVLVDVTDRVRSVQVRRGRSTQLEKFTAGNANLVIDNRDRALDPLNASSPYYGSILPGKEILIDHDGYPIYSGNVADWNFTYDLNGDSLAEPSAVDGFAIIAPQVRTPGTAISQKTGARVAAVLTEIGWPLAQRDISTGQATLDADVVGDNVNALAYLSQVADVSEPGALFVSKTGAMTFRDRADLQAYTTGVTFGPSGIPFTGISVDYGSEQLVNSVNVTFPNGAVVAGTATASDATSQTRYGVIDKTYTTLLDTLVDAQALANWQVALYAEPVYRVNTLTVNLSGITSIQVGQVLDLELGDAVQVSWTPNGIGSAITQIVSIDGISHEATPSMHSVTFDLSQTLAAFILNDAVFGVLDDDILGF